jgi:hypothetical protein
MDCDVNGDSSVVQLIDGGHRSDFWQSSDRFQLKTWLPPLCDIVVSCVDSSDVHAVFHA